jgi:hypothetical protein
MFGCNLPGFMLHFRNIGENQLIDSLPTTLGMLTLLKSL